MAQVVIENPIINSPFDEPTRHFRFNDDGITDEEVSGRRVSSYFVPIAPSKKRNGTGKQAVFDTEWTKDRIEVNKLVNDIRRRVAIWRKGGFIGVTPTTSRLIAYWTDAAREKKLFFCQNEALQTAIYIVEVAKKRRCVAEPGSDSASKFKLVAFVEADQQSAKILSRALRLGVPADDEFLLLAEFEF